MDQAPYLINIIFILLTLVTITLLIIAINPQLFLDKNDIKINNFTINLRAKSDRRELQRRAFAREMADRRIQRRRLGDKL